MERGKVHTMCKLRGVTGKFFWGAKSFFLFFPGLKCFFPIENVHFGRPKTNFSGFEKWGKKRKKKVLSLFCNFSTFHFQFYTFLFTVFLLFFSIFTPFPFFCTSFFPVGQKFPCQKSLGDTLPPAPCPRLLRHFVNWTPSTGEIPFIFFLKWP